jgi:hypothetical protein
MVAASKLHQSLNFVAASPSARGDQVSFRSRHISLSLLDAPRAIVEFQHEVVGSPQYTSKCVINQNAILRDYVVGILAKDVGSTVYFLTTLYGDFTYSSMEPSCCWVGVRRG